MVMDWIKRIFGIEPEQAVAPFEATQPVVDLMSATPEEIEAENLRLGREVDALRERRRALVHRAAQLRDGGQ